MISFLTMKLILSESHYLLLLLLSPSILLIKLILTIKIRSTTNKTIVQTILLEAVEKPKVTSHAQQKKQKIKILDFHRKQFHFVMQRLVRNSQNRKITRVKGCVLPRGQERASPSYYPYAPNKGYQLRRKKERRKRGDSQKDLAYDPSYHIKSFIPTSTNLYDTQFQYHISPSSIVLLSI